MVVWASNGQDGSGYGIYGQRFGYGGSRVESELQINTTTAGDQTRPKIAGLWSGRFAVVWQSSGQDGSGAGIYGQLFTGASEKHGAEFRVNSHTDGNQSEPAIAPLADGGFVVVWTSNMQDGSGRGVYAQRFGLAANPLGAERRVNTVTAGDQSAPQVAGLMDGGFVVVWQSPDADGLGIFGQRYDADGLKVGAQFAVNRTEDYEQSLPGVAGLDNGGFVVVWQSDLQDGSGLGVYAQRYTSAGARAGGETLVNTTTAGDQWQPAVASFSFGGYVVVWTSDGQDGSGTGISAQAFRTNGARADVEFGVNTRTAGDQWQPAVGGCAIPEFRVAWVKRDGDSFGVFSQMFVVPAAFGFSFSAARSSTWVPGANCSPP